MKTIYSLLFVILLSSCGPIINNKAKSSSDEIIASGIQAPPAKLPYLGSAPELPNTVWLNSSSPLRLADLTGNVVLLEMWTFG